MAIDEYEVVRATAADIDGILDLQERNQPERGGALSARLPRAWLEAAVAGMRWTMRACTWAFGKTAAIIPDIRRPSCRRLP